jgi:hypothetical protein
MNNCLLLTVFAMVAAFFCQTAYSEPLKPCRKLIYDVVMEYAKAGYTFALISGEVPDGEMLFSDGKSALWYVDMLTPPGHPPPPEVVRLFNLRGVDECVAPSPTGAQVPYKHWSGTALIGQSRER